MRKIVQVIIIVLISSSFLYSQENNLGIEVSKANCNGLVISSIVVNMSEGGKPVNDKSKENEIIKSFAIGTSSAFEISIFDFAVKNISKLDYIKSVDYKLFSTGVSDNLTLMIIAELKEKGAEKTDISKGIFVKGRGFKDFPVLIENNSSRLSLILTGGLGTFTDFDAFFKMGNEFTKGSPIASNPAQPGYASWLETSYELGLGGLIQLGSLPVYPYFGISGMVTGSTGQDLYTNYTRGFTDFEKGYLGVIFTDPRNGFVTNLSAGRQSYQLNDGLLFSKYSGSANAGQRASLYLSARTAYEKTAMLKIRYKSITLEGTFLEPEELNFSPSNTQFVIGTLGYNDNSAVDAGFSYINIVNSNSKYPNKNNITMTKEGLYAFNPKIWINSLFGNKSIKLRSEYVYEGNRNFDMAAYAFYASAGYVFDKLPFSPKLTYRYSYMSGDDSATVKYERFDPMQIGGLGNWIQGLNFRKVCGNGNIGAHRIQLELYPKSNMLVSLDYFYLWAPQLYNLGGSPPLSSLQDNKLGQEITLTYKYFISNQFTLLGIISTAFPGDGIKKAFVNDTNPWTSFQLALFMHIL